MLILMPLIPALSHAEIPKQIPKHLLKYQLKWRNSKKTILNTYRMFTLFQIPLITFQKIIIFLEGGIKNMLHTIFFFKS